MGSYTVSFSTFSSPYNSPLHTASTHSRSLLTVVRFSNPVSVITTTSSMRTPPTLSYLASTSWLMSGESRTAARRCGEK